ncbi:MAG: hypothetical protein KAR47_06720, partial [Planctomycetes bacterium]|nr:hypothetical protein [Planctomycetota bacterium]
SGFRLCLKASTRQVARIRLKDDVSAGLRAQSRLWCRGLLKICIFFIIVLAILLLTRMARTTVIIETVDKYFFLL